MTGHTIDSILFQFTISANVYAGDWYQIKVRAKNMWGWGAFSPVLLIKAATKPSKLASPAITAVDPATGGILIQWTAPFSNAETITAYKVEIINKAGVPVEETQYCDGST